MSAPAIVFFCMDQEGHNRRLFRVLAGLTRRDIPCHVFTHQRFAADVRRAGGTFVDLFDRRPLPERSPGLVPNPCRYVVFAGAHTAEVAQEVAVLRPSLVVYDTFAVIGRAVAITLGIPYVNVCAGHNVSPERVPELLTSYPTVAISDECERAVAVLREEHGMEDASPFSYVTGLSPFLNLYSEPPAYLTEEERKPFEPVAFFGSLPGPDEEAPVSDRPWFADRKGLKLYVSFGTVVWHYFAAQAIAALRSISTAVAARPEVDALVSLGGADVDTAVTAELAAPANVRVERYVDQRAVLSQADAFVTHHGLNSTHEAVAGRVPMLSYPFFWDQPSLADRSQQFDLALPLRREEEIPEHLSGAAARLSRGLDNAARWERDVIDQRDAVLERIVTLR
jgi:MGT family glycosyltransferase